MQDVMVLLQEIPLELVQLSRAACAASAGQGAPPGPAAVAARPVVSDPEPQDLTADGPEELPSASSSGAVSNDAALKAIRCATGINDAVVLHALATTLPPSILQEQVALIDADGERKALLPGQPQLVDPRLFSDCTRVYHEFAQYLRDNGCPQTTTRRKQMPRGIYKRFLQERVAFKGPPLRNAPEWLRKMYWAWRQKGHVAPTLPSGCSGGGGPRRGTRGQGAALSQGARSRSQGRSRRQG